MRCWEHFEHQADIGVRGIGDSLEQAFEETASALLSVITDLQSVSPAEEVTLECHSSDQEVLLLDWLDSIIYEIATRRMLFSRFEVHIQGSHLIGKLWGEPVDVARHSPAVEIKGSTFTCLSVRKQGDGNWVAQCVVDV